MNSYVLAPTKVVDIPREILTRNFGLKGKIKTKRQVAFEQRIGSVVKITDEYDEDAIVWASTIKGEWYWASTIISSFENLFQLPPSKYGAFEVTGKKLQENIVRIEDPEVDATNIHKKLVNHKGKRFHMKEYTRPEKGAREILVGPLLTKHKIFPELMKGLIWINEGKYLGLVAIFEEQDIQESLDEKSYFLLRQILSHKASIEEYFDLICKAHEILSEFHVVLASVGQGFTALIPTLYDEFRRNLLSTGLLSKELISIANRVLEEMSTENNEGQIIHGDIWWRQFSRTAQDQILLLDLEDLSLGNPCYDYASMYCGIRNQLEYASNELAKTPEQKEIINNLKEKVKQFYQNLDLDLFDEFVLLRTIHEYAYSLQRFGKESWIVNFTFDEIKKLEK